MFQNECSAERTTRIHGDDIVKTMRRFDRERTTERIRKHREQMLLCETIGVFTLSERLGEILEREQAHQRELATALGDRAQAATTGC